MSYPENSRSSTTADGKRPRRVPDIKFSATDLGLPPKHKLCGKIIFRPTLIEDIEDIKRIMSYWLGTYHDQFPEHADRRNLLHKIFKNNIERINHFVSGCVDRGHFFTLVKSGIVLGVTGYLDGERMNQPLREFLDKKSNYTDQHGNYYDLRKPVPEMCFLYTSPNPEHREDIPIGRVVMNGLKGAIYQAWRAGYFIFTSRRVWWKDGWAFYDRQPDFECIGVLGDIGGECAPEERDTRVYLVRECNKPVPITLRS
ncbi:MAG: hypothetical protein N2691_05885 [Patescibacteria group bacterium]|nr:hypothetical protein [Patescibacteria group bacterium]